MAKIRSLKGEFFRNADISKGGLIAKVLAAGTICAVADDDGRFKGQADYLKGEIFTHDAVTAQDIEQALQHLVSVGFIRSYREHGRAFGAVVSWKTHQRVPPTRYIPSELPAPPNTKQRRHSSTSRKQSPTDASSRTGVGSEGNRKGKEGIGEEGRGVISPTAHPASAGGELLVLEPQVSISPDQQVFEAWKQATGHQRTALDDKRRKICAARLKEGWTVDELVLAVSEGWRNDPWTERPLHNQFEVLLRDAAHVEKFLKLAQDGPPMIRPKKSNLELSVEADEAMISALRSVGR